MSLLDLANATQEAPPVEPPAQEVPPVEPQAPAFDKPEWMNDDFVGDNLEDSTLAQAQAYKAAPVAPETYEALSFDADTQAIMDERGITALEMDNPIVVQLSDVLKKHGGSQELMNDIAKLHMNNQWENEDGRINQLISDLGEKSQSRVQEIQQWTLGQDEATQDLISKNATTLEGIELIELFMKKGNPQPNMQTPNGEQGKSDYSDELYSLQSDPKYRTDVSYRNEVLAKASKWYDAGLLKS